MLKVRIIPTMLWKDVGLVKGIGFDSWRRTGTLLPAVKVYNTRQVDELILLDISATAENRAPDFDMISEVSAECFVPFTVGGGISGISHIRELLLAGADKVCVNSIAYRDPEVVREACERFGSQCIVASIDARRTADGSYECHSHSGSRATGKPPVEWARELEAIGVGEILITSIDRDGTMQGYDLELIRSISQAVAIPVIASGGAGGYGHFLSAITEAGASAVAAASMFHFTEQTPLEAKRYLGSRSVPVRNSRVAARPSGP
jgi:cyclase